MSDQDDIDKNIQTGVDLGHTEDIISNQTKT